MIVKYTRHHKAQPVQYEEIFFGAAIEVDLDTDPDFEGLSLKKSGQLLEELMDDVLDSAVTRALRSEGDKIETTHLWSYYERD